MPVSLDGKKLIPAPFCAISKEMERNEDKGVKNITYVITLKGSLMAYMGSPNSLGQFWTASGYPADESVSAESRLKAIIAKQGALTNLFCNENKLLEVQPYDGSPPLKGTVRLRSMSFDEGNWFDRCTYTITLEADTLFFGNIEVCSANVDNIHPEETWSIEQGDENKRSFRLTHSATATAKTSHDINGNIIKGGWERARDVILKTSAPGPFLGIDPAVYAAPNITKMSGAVSGYNYTRGHSIDKANGKYTISESWVLYDPALTGGVPCLEEYNIDVRTDENGRTRVSINGTINGLEVRDNTTYDLVSTKYDNALARWNQIKDTLQTICADNAGVTLNPTPLSKGHGKNIINGVITFTQEYDDRPVVADGAISTTIQVSNKYPTDIFASLVVLGKEDGPVLQPINTVTSRERRLSIEIAYPNATAQNPVPAGPNKVTIDALVQTYKPTATSVFLTQDEDNWSPQNGRFSRNVAWTYKL